MPGKKQRRRTGGDLLRWGSCAPSMTRASPRRPQASPPHRRPPPSSVLRARPLLTPYFTALAARLPRRPRRPRESGSPASRGQSETDWLPSPRHAPLAESAASEGTEAGGPLRPVRGFRGGSSHDFPESSVLPRLVSSPHLGDGRRPAPSAEAGAYANNLKSQAPDW